MWKKWLKVSLTAVLAITVTACNSSKSTAPKMESPSPSNTDKVNPTETPKNVVLRVDLWGHTAKPNDADPRVRVAAQKIAEQFEKLNPGVKVEFPETALNTMNGEQATNLHNTRLASNEDFDIYFFWNGELKDGANLDMTPYLDQPNPYVKGNEHWKDLFDPALVDQVKKLNDGIVNIPLSYNVGAPVVLFYNKDILDKLGVSAPKTFEEEMTFAKKAQDAGYTGLMQWPDNKGKIGNWPFDFDLGPTIATKQADKLDWDKNGVVNDYEFVRDQKLGFFSPVKNEYVRDFYKQWKRKASFWPKDWATGDTNQLWKTGKVAFKEGGIWEISPEASDTKRSFKFGVIPLLPVESDTTKNAVDVPRVKTKDASKAMFESFGIMKESAKSHGTTELAVKFLQFITTPENNEFLVNEDAAGIPAVNGTKPAGFWSEWLDTTSPKLPTSRWYSAAKPENSDMLFRTMDLWFKNSMTDEEFFKTIDQTQAKDIQQVMQDDKENPMYNKDNYNKPFDKTWLDYKKK